MALQGVVLKPRFTRGTHTFDFPLLLSHEPRRVARAAGRVPAAAAGRLRHQAPHHPAPAALAQDPPGGVPSALLVRSGAACMAP